MRLFVQAPVTRGTSWGRYGGWLHEALRAADSSLVAEEILRPGQRAPGEEYAIYLIVGPPALVVQQLGLVAGAGARAIVYTSFEATSMPRFWATALSQARVVVPSRFNQVVFAASLGVATQRIAHGLHPAFGVSTFAPRPTYDSCRIGIGGAWRGAGERKRLSDLVHGFVRFLDSCPPSGGVRLCVRLPDLPDWVSPELRDSQGIGWTIGDNLSPTEQVAWYDTLDVYLSASAGEGFDFMSAEAIARGVPVIAPNWGATAELPLTVRLPFELAPMRIMSSYYQADAFGARVSQGELEKAWVSALRVSHNVGGSKILPLDPIRTHSDCAADLLRVVYELIA